MSSFKTSSFVVLVSWRLTASSQKNSRSCTGLRSSLVGRHNGNDWLLATQRAITLLRMQFPYRVACDVPLFLAPMAGVSESPFRLLCRRFGADVVVSEFISAVGVARGLEHLFQDMRFEEAERPIGIQLYGADATVMARGAEMVTAGLRAHLLPI